MYTCERLVPCCTPCLSPSLGVIDPDLEALVEVPGAALGAGGPRAGADAHLYLGGDDGAEAALRVEVGQDGGDGRVDLERDEEEEGGEAE